MRINVDVQCFKTSDDGKILTAQLTEDAVLVIEPEKQRPTKHQMWAVMKDGSDEIKYSSYCEQDAEWHCNVFLHETVRLIQWNT
jgi:hypothetical protein